MDLEEDSGTTFIRASAAADVEGILLPGCSVALLVELEEVADAPLLVKV